jgi:hypothetical protein
VSGLCLAAATFTLTLPFQSFTLMWIHSIEKIRWEEDYRAVERRLELVEARIRGFGAGMEPPDGSHLKDGVWHYQPQNHWLERLRLARSGYVADYSLCWDGSCHPLAELAGTPETAPVVEFISCD